MSPEDAPEDPSLETDPRFPSGPWEGFFLQPLLKPGKHGMELILTFRQGVLTGEGRDRVGKFHIRGRYDTQDGKCWWTKRYVGKHDVSYMGYNEGKGIWGTWEMKAPPGRGGFYIWPVGMGDPTRQVLREAIDQPTDPEAEPAGERKSRKKNKAQPVGAGTEECRWIDPPGGNPP